MYILDAPLVPSYRCCRDCVMLRVLGWVEQGQRCKHSKAPVLHQAPLRSSLICVFQCVSTVLINSYAGQTFDGQARKGGQMCHVLAFTAGFYQVNAVRIARTS